MPNNKNRLKYSALGFQMAITIGLGAWGGQYLDKKYNNSDQLWTITLILVAIAVAIYQVIRDVIKMNKDTDTEPKDEHGT